MKNYSKYSAYENMQIKQRQWPDKVIEKAPIWCSVDLRDGNQALEIPMNIEQKLCFFNYLIKIGFKEIEIGFPAASETEYEFTRMLIEKNLIPDDVKIQVLTQSREEIIKKTFDALKGAKNAIVHLYNSTSTLQRDVVFNFDKQQTIDLAIYGARLIKKYAKENPEIDFTFEYSPESFTGTEIDFSKEICNKVINEWHGETKNKIIINLPATVEMSTPNIYADQIEYMCAEIEHRDNVIVSLHTHNDRGTAVAAAEFGIMAGGDRIEGTLFGNGERTGNSDIVNIALNMFTQGVDPMLDFTNINEAIDIYESMTNMKISKRHPYAGDLVYTAFSGSHQDAIRKGMNKMKERKSKKWSVPYLPIDPFDVGRNYDPIIRINSQSGKGGVAYILEQDYGMYLPKEFQKEFSKIITEKSDKNHMFLSSKNIYDTFMEEYVDIKSPMQLVHYNEIGKIGTDDIEIEAEINFAGEKKIINGNGNGILAAFCSAIENGFGRKIEIVDYMEHSMTYGTKSKAISYVQFVDENSKNHFGAGISNNISKSSLVALISAINNNKEEA